MKLHDKISWPNSIRGTSSVEQLTDCSFYLEHRSSFSRSPPSPGLVSLVQSGSSTPRRARSCTQAFFSGAHVTAQGVSVLETLNCAPYRGSASSAYQDRHLVDTALTACTTARSRAFSTPDAKQDTVVKVITTENALQSAMSSLAAWLLNFPLKGFVLGHNPPNTTWRRSCLSPKGTFVVSAPAITYDNFVKDPELGAAKRMCDFFVARAYPSE